MCIVSLSFLLLRQSTLSSINRILVVYVIMFVSQWELKLVPVAFGVTISGSGLGSFGVSCSNSGLSIFGVSCCIHISFLGNKGVLSCSSCISCCICFSDGSGCMVGVSGCCGIGVSWIVVFSFG